MEEKIEKVNNPSHYQADDLSCIDVMLKLYGKEAVLNFCMLNSFKYQWRCNKKENCTTDLKKARWYMNKFIELLEEGNSNITNTNSNKNAKASLLKEGLTHREAKNIITNAKNGE